MKKRLLSAALALAMVLTLLPVSAFAVPNPGVTSVSYYTAGQTVTVAGQTQTISSAGWYETNTTDPVTSGVVASSGNSGTWFDNIANAMGANQTYIKLLGDSSESGPLFVNRAMTVDLNGHTASNVQWSINGSYQLTLCDTATSGAVKSAGASISLNGQGRGAATIILTDVSVGSITLNGMGDGTNVNYAQRVTLNGGQVSSTVTLKGNSSTLTLNPSTKNSTVSITGAVTMDGASGLVLNAMNSGNTRGVFSFGGAVTMTQTGAGGQANFGSQTGSGSVTGKFALTSPSGGTVAAYNTTFTGGAELTGYGATFGATSCNIQTALAVGGVGSGTALTDSQKNSLNAPTVNIVGGNVALLGAPQNWGEQLTKGYTVNISGNARVGALGFDNAAVTVTSSAIGTSSGGVILVNGTLTLAGDGSDAGNITLGGTGYGSAVLNVTGTNVTTGAIDVATGNTRTVSVNIPASDTNYFERLGSATNGTLANGSAVVKGGGFGAKVKVDYLDNSLQLQVENTNTGAKAKYVYYGTTATDMNNLVAAYQKASNKDSFKVTPVHDGTGTDEANFQLADGETSGTGGDPAPNIVLKITFKKDKAQTFTLPTWVNNREVGVWTLASDENIQRNGGATYMTTEDATFNAQVGNYSLTKLTNVAVSTNGNLNPGVTATLSGNTIKLSGNVTEKGTATIPLVLTTDNGDKVNISVGWNGTVTNFSSKADPDVLNVVDNGLALQVVNSSVKYTLDGSGLRRQVEKLNIGKGEIVTTIANSVPGTALFRENLGKAMSSKTAASFDFSGSGAVSEAFGRAIAAITDSNIVSWRTSAQNTAWRNEGNTGTPTDQQRQSTGYSDVYIVPYLNVNVTSIDNSGLMTATMEPYYRIEVRVANNTKDPIVVQTGRTMGVLSGEMGEVEVVLPVEEAFQEGFDDSGYAHQNATYVYEVDGTASDDGTPARLSFTITHAANTGNGFGTIVINNVAPLVRLEDKDGDSRGAYDALQAAVDDAENTDVITVDAAYKGNRTINVTGVARTFKVDAKGPDGIKVSNTADTVSWQNDGGVYTVQLLRNNAPAPTEKPIPITVASVTGGSASLSASRANEGETITVTLTPSANYRVGGVTVTAAVKNSTTGATTNTTVATTAASTNSWRFVVPTGATSVTVTPSFTKTQTTTNPTVTVSNPNRGRGTATTSAGSNQVAPGTTVTVSTAPASGQRTMGLSVTGATAYRIGENQFTFTVPSGYATVVVTPTFDAQNGTSFSDVWSTEYFSPAVAWAVGRGITNGTSTYTFGSYNSCTREDMVTFLYRAAGSPAVGNVRNPFWDVQPGSYYYNAVMWAVSKGITNGVSSNQFGVGQNVTRAQAVTFLYRYNGSPAASTNSGFYDVPSSEYYAKAVSWANATGVTNGTSTTAFSPNQNCQRAQIVSFLYRNATGARA